jgi:hypothetical protein
MNKTDKIRIRNEIASEILDSRAWLKVSKKTHSKQCIARFEGEISAFRIAGKIIGK